MKKLKNITLLSTLLFSSFSLSASEFHCKIEINKEEVHNTSFEVLEGQKVKFADSPDLKFFLKSIDKNKFELEAFDLSIPSRTYAIGNVKESGDGLNYTLWTRDSLIETECELK